MTKQSLSFLFLLLLLSACFLRRKEFRQTQFTYTRNGQLASVPLIVPKGYTKEEKADTAGVALLTYHYPNGAILYSAFLQDTTVALQPFDTRLHQPRTHRTGGLVYKGQDENELYYREIRQGHLRFGYWLVPRDVELQFDSATNFASLQRNGLQ